MRKPAPTRDARDLLLRLLEAESASVPAGMLERIPDAARWLKDQKLIKPDGYDSVAADVYDRPVELIWSGTGFGYFSELDGWVSVSSSAIERFSVDIERVLLMAAAKLQLPKRWSAEPLVAGSLWGVGNLRFGRRTKRNPVVFGRRLHAADVWASIGQFLGRQPSQERRVILTSTPPELVPDAPKGSLIVCLQDVWDPLLAIAAETIAIRLSGTSTKPKEDLAVIADGKEVHFFEKIFRFPKGNKQRAVIRFLHQKYLRGELLISTAEVAEECELTGSTRLRDLFKRHPNAWGQLLAERDGVCGFLFEENKESLI
jgi:hypothetical protein